MLWIAGLRVEPRRLLAGFDKQAEQNPYPCRKATCANGVWPHKHRGVGDATTRLRRRADWERRGGCVCGEPLERQLTGRGERRARVVSRWRADWERGREGARGEPLES